MINRAAIISFFLLNICNKAGAQILLKGRIYQATTDSVLAAVNVSNVTKNRSVHSGQDGRYYITAEEGDKVIFSMTGFKTETLTVTYGLLLTQYDVTLSPNIILLKSVTVSGSYQADSLARRNYYQYIYEKQPGITGRNRPTDGIGISLSPISYFSREARQKRQLKKRLINYEREAYIDHSFPVEWVERITGLHGDSLHQFMFRYRPSYSFCRKTGREAMLYYINEKLKEFKMPSVKK